MAYSRSVYVLFLRQVYLNGGDTEAERRAYLDALATKAMASIASGKMLVSASAGGSSHSYQAFADWSPAMVADMVEWAYGHIALDPIDDAIVEVAPRVRSFRTATTSEGIYG